MQRLALNIYGIVQGVGFRPFIKNLADQYELSGWVQNTYDGVYIEVQGLRPSVDKFLGSVRQLPPTQAKIHRIDIRETTVDKIQSCKIDFRIRESVQSKSVTSTLSPDIAICEQCLAEIRSPTSRRYRYPFTNCAHCGPRYSITIRFPYDRENTSMRFFKMCALCRSEYENPKDRRYHAQPIACPVCGPQVQFMARNGTVLAAGDNALNQAIKAICEGKIIAVKALGGFQLCLDASNESAVRLLRKRKQRPDKPFAIMCKSLGSVVDYCSVTSKELDVLTSSTAPITLLRKVIGLTLADAIAPGNPRLGVALAYTPLHHLLLENLTYPIVCTSGNQAGEPMCIETDEALTKLGLLADYFLTNNRRIERPLDDSVVQINDSVCQVLRRARGYAPLPLILAEKNPCVVALGGHQKNTVALVMDQQLILSQYIGNLDSYKAVESSQWAAKDLIDFYETAPDRVACDMHPDYSSTLIARDFALKYKVPLEIVQHHHAHAVSAMAEHQLSGPVLALCWDGTGYGSDGTTWGSEALVCTYRDFSRKVHLKSFGLLGGEQAIKDPRRVAFSMAYQVFGEKIPAYILGLFSKEELGVFQGMLEKSFNCPRSTAMGRLFDAVAVLSGIQRKSSFEGHAAMAVEFAADRELGVKGVYPIPLCSSSDGTYVADWRPLLFSIHEDRRRRTRPGVIAARFHNSLASLAENIALKINLPNVVLSGGCFQNTLLTKKVSARLRKAGLEVHNHCNVPPNDGGLALGQALVVAARSRSVCKE